ncbi:MAG TPA: hypothetical protein VNT77_02715 [Allosphingosinicella sp.]|nr:hypothetical protein [Allosphingosinicella sp.]
MFNYDQIGRIALSAVGALILTGTVVGAAVGPARAIETTPVIGFQTQLSVQAGA